MKIMNKAHDNLQKLRLLKIVLDVVSVIYALNLVAFVGVAIWLGGDAINGKAINGHYFLGSHGTYTEVSEAIFTYSKQHAHSVLFSLPIGFAASFVSNKLKNRIKPMPP